MGYQTVMLRFETSPEIPILSEAPVVRKGRFNFRLTYWVQDGNVDSDAGYNALPEACTVPIVSREGVREYAQAGRGRVIKFASKLRGVG